MSQSSELRVESSELKPVRCGCGGEAKVEPLPFETWSDIWDASVSQYLVRCDRCGMTTRLHDTKAEAVQAWNRAMGERIVKVIEHDASVTDTDGYKYHRSEYLCGACKKKVIGGDEYCSHCGCRLI